MTTAKCSDFRACLEELMKLEIDKAVPELDRVSSEHMVSDGGTLEGIRMIAAAYLELREFDNAVRWYKKGVDRYPNDSEVVKGLRNARLAVLENLESDSESEAEAIEEERIQSYQVVKNHTSRTSIQPFDFRSDTQFAENSIVSKIMNHLNGVRLFHLIVYYTFLELLNLWQFSVGTSFIALGAAIHVILRSYSMMLISIVAVCAVHSRLRKIVSDYVYSWVKSSNDKLGIADWIPNILLSLPLVLKIVGQIKFQLFLHQSWCLEMIVTLVTGFFLYLSRCHSGWEHVVEGKRLRIIAYIVTLLYWGAWCGHWKSCIHLLGTALIETGSVILISINAKSALRVTKSAWQRVWDDVYEKLSEDIDFDLYFLMGLSQCIMEYWQTPTTFSLEMLQTMLQNSVATMEVSAVNLFRPEIQRLRAQIGDIQSNSDDLFFLIQYLKQKMKTMPPSKWPALLGLLARRCPSYLVLFWLITFQGFLPIALLPFLFVEWPHASDTFTKFQDCSLFALDGYEILLMDSPLLAIWSKYKSAIIALETSLTFSKAVQTGTKLIQNTYRIGKLVQFAKGWHQQGLGAVDELPDHITSLFLFAQESILLRESLESLSLSTQIQEAKEYLRRWWPGTMARTNE
uniref:Uncharacterized protein AlNc14C72G4911 n=1 Tax=Albugo laibachii Nc14 TaxID=890382 RepID=F0WE50_9STRA|nr:conserved hypothetical protein [Albugo laibachii Nc14]|eukprot:CCA19479.1 conserved hypothetical protein [Albugo laibachii Nc14]